MDAGDIIQTVKSAAIADMRRLKAITTMANNTAPKLKLDEVLPDHETPRNCYNSDGDNHRPHRRHRHLDRWHASVERVLTRLPRTALCIVIVQHMPEKFTAAFADRLKQNLRTRK